MLLGRLLGNHVSQYELGLVLGADGMLRLAPGLVRIPDVSFVSWQRLPGGELPDQVIVDLAPDLAVEIVSKRNTREEMDRKLREYFAAGVQQVWYVCPESREVRVFSGAEQHVTLCEHDTLEGRDVLARFRLGLNEFFAPPRRPAR
jgi:Uma2 family endonuclease